MLGLALVLPALTVLVAAPAAAHAVLVASDPTDGARLPSSPTQVTLTFDEPIRLMPTGTQVISDAGVRVDTGPALTADGATIVLPLQADLAAGSYTATWDVISADTHKVVGSISFGVGRDAHAVPAGLTPGRDGPVDVGAELARGAQFVGLVLGVGVVLVCAALWPWTLNVRTTQVLCATGLALLILASLAEVVTAAVRDSGALVTVAASRQGAVTLTRLALTALFAVVLPQLFGGPRKVTITVTAAVCAALSATIAMDGHAGVGADATLATVLTSAHVGAMALWLGGLTALGMVVLPSRHTDNLHRWSATAATCVAVLVVTGCYQAWRQIAPVQALWSTAYGWTLSVKVVAVGAMLVLAYLARRRLTPRRLRRTVSLEAGIGVAVLAVTTVLVALPPARTSYGPPMTLDAPLDGGRHVLIRIASTRHGPTAIRASVLDAAGRPTPALSMAGDLSSREAQIPFLPVDFTAETNDWVSTYASAPRPGLWTLRLTVRFGQTDAVVTTVGFRAW
ncbi:hypothetical protein BayCH28_05600 [Mycolicibacterium sp. CH28]|nr:hypothetical protein BayCH28_05600 [Mycolicibacterium sp. CH28]